MMAEGRAVAVGIFENHVQAHDAVGGLKAAGIAAEDIELLLAAPEAGQHLGDTLGANAEAPASSDAPGGGLAAGALDDTLSKVAIGAGPGVVAAGLVGYGLPAEQAHWYEQEARKGAALVSVQVHGPPAEVEALLRQHGAYRTAETPAARAGALLQDDAPSTSPGK
jgi:hypothetical protein